MFGFGSSKKKKIANKILWKKYLLHTMTCPKTTFKCATKHEFTPNQRQNQHCQRAHYKKCDWTSQGLNNCGSN